MKKYLILALFLMIIAGCASHSPRKIDNRPTEEELEQAKMIELDSAIKKGDASFIYFLPSNYEKVQQKAFEELDQIPEFEKAMDYLYYNSLKDRVVRAYKEKLIEWACGENEVLAIASIDVLKRRGWSDIDLYKELLQKAKFESVKRLIIDFAAKWENYKTYLLMIPITKEDAFSSYAFETLWGSIKGTGYEDCEMFLLGVAKWSPIKGIQKKAISEMAEQDTFMWAINSRKLDDELIQQALNCIFDPDMLMRINVPCRLRQSVSLRYEQLTGKKQFISKAFTCN